MKTYDKTHPAAIVAAFDKIMQSELFRLNGPAIDLPDALIEMGNALADTETDESLWSLGEFGECDIGSLIVGAYWALTEWHGGQYSQSYAAMCALGRVFSPGCTSAPTSEDQSEFYPYQAVGEWFKSHPKA